jgi:hypothetical protein
MMIKLAIIALVAGALLDRYKVMILAPTIVFSVLLAAGVGALLAYSLWSIFVMVVVLVVAVQVGYLARIAVRAVAERFQPKVERMRLAKAIEREQAEHEAA